MTILEAHAMLAVRDPETGRDAFPYTANLPDGTDCWPATATAACVLAGGVENAASDRDLDELLQHWQSLLSMGVRDGDDLQAATFDVIDELMEWGG